MFNLWGRILKVKGFFVKIDQNSTALMYFTPQPLLGAVPCARDISEIEGNKNFGMTRFQCFDFFDRQLGQDFEPCWKINFGTHWRACTSVTSWHLSKVLLHGPLKNCHVKLQNSGITDQGSTGYHGRCTDLGRHKIPTSPRFFVVAPLVGKKPHLRDAQNAYGLPLSKLPL